MDSELLMILVSETLDEAGFLYSIQGGPLKRSGYSIKQLSGDGVAVESETDNPQNYSRGMELALSTVGFTVTRPFSDRNTLKVTKD
jgi:hypothetical protein